MTEFTTNSDYFIELIKDGIETTKYAIEIKNVFLAYTAYNEIWTITDVAMYSIRDEEFREKLIEFVEGETEQLKENILAMFAEVLSEKEDEVEYCFENTDNGDEEESEEEDEEELEEEDDSEDSEEPEEEE